MKKGLLLLILLIAMGCTTTQPTNSTKSVNKTTNTQNSTNELPEWFYTPAMGIYKYAGVGVAKKSAHGVSRQRQLALQRAIDEIAAQMNTKVSTVSEFVTTKNNTNYMGYSLHTVDGQTVSAILMEIWIDKEKNELYAWLVVEK